MIGGALWVFPPKAAARKATPEEVELFTKKKGIQSGKQDGVYSKKP